MLGVFPALGWTTLLCLLVAVWLKLNVPAMQLVNYLAYPLQLALLVPFIRAGELLFRAPRLVISLPQILAMVRADVWHAITALWVATMHAIAVWTLIAPVAVYLIYKILLPSSYAPGAGQRTGQAARGAQAASPRRAERMLSLGLQLAFSGAAALAVMMFLIWLLSVRLNNAGIVDVGWSLGLVIFSVWYAWQGPGFAPRRWIMAGMVTFWGLRLALHLVRRIASEPEDGRYQQLRREWAGKNINLRFLFFFEFQALLDVLLSLPILLAALNPAPQLSALEYAGVALWLVAVIGESVADAQLAAFKRNPANRGRVCHVGLWRYSRHPNYFFEWFIWVAWMVYALGVAMGMGIRDMPGTDAVLPVPRHRHSGDRGAGAALARG